MMSRFEILYEYSKELRKRNPSQYADKSRCLDLFAEPGFSALSFMQRTARMIEATLDETAVRIYPNEIIVGSVIECRVRSIHNTFEERRMYADQNCAYPRRNNIYLPDDQIYSSSPLYLTDKELEDPETARWGWGHSCAGFQKILKMGYEGIEKQAADKLLELQQNGTADRDQTEFLEAVITSARAVCRFSNRYGDELEKLAAEETDAVRAKELLEIADRVRRVPAKPAESFLDALQSAWFAWVCSIWYNGTDMGRMDQYLYPYYKKDIEAGRLTLEEAEDLVNCFMLKLFEYYIVIPNNAGLHPSIMLGGLMANGKDGCNDVTMLFLKAKETLRTPSPKLSLRVNEQTPQEIIEQAHKMLLSGINQPDFYMDRNVIHSYERIGIPFEDAVEYAQSVCEELSLAGISEDCTNEGPHLDVHDKVMRAMVRAAAGEKADTFDAFMKLVEEEMRLCLLEEIDYCEKQTAKLRTFSPRPLHSATIEGCIENAKDITAGGARYNNSGSVIGGLASAADGLYAIRRLVYEEKRLTIKEFLTILQNEYEGEEPLRQEILHRFPKFGNDCEEVDLLAKELFDIFADELEKHTNSRGGRYKLGAWASEYRSPYPATPDGRRKGDAFATNISPTPGRDLGGVTAVMRSACHLPLKHCSAGGMLDVAMTPSCLRGENGAVLLRQLLEAYGDMGGTGLQFNVVDADTLRAALDDPDSYRSLMVRVWGYNDFFTALTPARQSHILSRTIQEML